MGVTDKDACLVVGISINRVEPGIAVIDVLQASSIYMIHVVCKHRIPTSGQEMIYETENKKFVTHA